MTKAGIAYRRIVPGEYEILVDGEVFTTIERTGFGDGWADDWWIDLPGGGLLTATTLASVKREFERWHEGQA